MAASRQDASAPAQLSGSRIEKKSSSSDSTKRSSSKATRSTQAAADMSAGLCVGLCKALIFNPWDRAMYLSVKEHRPFLHRENFVNPFHGATQSMMQRAVTQGFYFPLKAVTNSNLGPYLTEMNLSTTQAHSVEGIFAGGMNGAISAPVSVIRHEVWGTEGASLRSSVTHLYKHGGAKVFFKGAGLTVVRDMLSAATYECLRHTLRSKTSSKFWSDFVAAATATALGSPMNYARRMKYCTPAGETPPNAVRSLIDLWRKSKQLHPQLKARTLYLCQRLSLGWGELRVGAGLAVGQHMFDLLQPLFRQRLGSL